MRPISRRFWLALISLLLLTAVILPDGQQTLFAQTTPTPTPVSFPLNKKIVVTLSPARPDENLGLIVPSAGDGVVVIDAPANLTFGVDVHYPQGGGYGGGGGGGSEPPNPRTPYHNIELLNDIPANTSVDLHIGLVEGVKWQVGVVVALYLVQRQNLSGAGAVDGQVTEDMPVAVFGLNVRSALSVIRLTGKRTGAFAIVKPRAVYDSDGKFEFYSCDALQYNAEYELTFSSLGDKCGVVINLPGTQGAGHFQISSSMYSPASVNSDAQTVTLSPQNPVVLLTFKQAAGENVEVAAQRFSEVPLDMLVAAADDVEYKYGWDHNRMVVDMPSRKDGVGFVYLTLPNNSQQRVTVEVWIKHGIVVL